MKQRIWSLKSIMVAVAVFICLSFTGGERCHGYVMPAEQLIGFMVRNFSAYETLVITQSTLWRDQDRERVFKEEIWMKSPGLCYAKILDPLEEGIERYDLSFRQLLLSNSRERIEEVLRAMGVNLQAVAYTRIDGVISYRIGDKGPEAPKLLIEKERFLPLLLDYRSPGEGQGEMVSVRFRDYRKQEKGWYPFEIDYSTGKGILEKYTILNFQPNLPVDASLLRPFEIGPRHIEKPGNKTLPGIEEERLRKIIKAFEEKYQ